MEILCSWLDYNSLLLFLFGLLLYHCVSCHACFGYCQIKTDPCGQKEQVVCDHPPTKKLKYTNCHMNDKGTLPPPAILERVAALANV